MIKKLTQHCLRTFLDGVRLQPFLNSVVYDGSYVRVGNIQLQAIYLKDKAVSQGGTSFPALLIRWERSSTALETGSSTESD